MPQPDSPAALRTAAVDAHRRGDLARAQDLYARYLALVPGDAGHWSNLGVLLRTTERHAMALRVQQRAYALTPDAPGVRNNYANILSDLGDYERSIALRHEALEKTPGDLNQLAMIGRCYRGMGKYRAAVAHLEPLVAQYPDEAEFQIQLAFARLGAGDYAQGFQDYRARWRSAELTPRKIPFPQWDGQTDLAGKSVLVLPEQGFGDAVLFNRLLPLLAAHSARVLLLVEKPMARLFQDVAGADWVGAALPVSEKVDYWVNVMDLPLLGLDSRADIPPPTRLHVPADSVARAQTIVAPYADSFRVGVVWTGSLTYKGNAFRSFSHTDFLPLTDLPGVQLFSLYKGPALDAYCADASNAVIIDAAGTDRDLADCAATMQQMDLVITSDTATAHIAGSLGLPCWTILHWDPFWVFTHRGAKTPWYPSMRLFRQTTPLDWSGVMGTVRDTLERHVSKLRGAA